MNRLNMVFITRGLKYLKNMHTLRLDFSFNAFVVDQEILQYLIETVKELPCLKTLKWNLSHNDIGWYWLTNLATCNPE